MSTPDRGFLAQLVLLGVVFYAITQGAMFVALAEQPAAATSLVLSLTPLFVAVGAAISLSEVPSRWQLFGAALVAIGAWLFFAAGLGATTAGMVAAIVALGADVVSALLGRSINRSGQLPPVKVTVASMAIGAGLLVFVGIGAEGVPDVSARGWLLIGWPASPW